MFHAEGSTWCGSLVPLAWWRDTFLSIKQVLSPVYLVSLLVSGQANMFQSWSLLFEVVLARRALDQNSSAGEKADPGATAVRFHAAPH